MTLARMAQWKLSPVPKWTLDTSWHGTGEAHDDRLLSAFSDLCEEVDAPASGSGASLCYKVRVVGAVEVGLSKRW